MIDPLAGFDQFMPPDLRRAIQDWYRQSSLPVDLACRIIMAILGVRGEARFDPMSVKERDALEGKLMLESPCPDNVVRFDRDRERAGGS